MSGHVELPHRRAQQAVAGIVHRAELANLARACAYADEALRSETIAQHPVAKRSGLEDRRRGAGMLQVHSCWLSPNQPQTQGFIAPTSMKLAGKLNDPCARLMVTTLSSRGWRSVSKFLGPNSGNSSKKRTPKMR